jgi:hypothetical protein
VARERPARPSRLRLPQLPTAAANGRIAHLSLHLIRSLRLPFYLRFIAWITTRLQSSANDCLAAATPSLTAVMTDSRCREIFVGLGGIGACLRVAAVVDRVIDIASGTLGWCVS